MDRIEIARQFLDDVLGPIPADSCLELRLKKNDEKGSRQKFYPAAGSVDVTQFAMDEHVWFGICLRKIGSSTGTAEDLTWASSLWADFDRVDDKPGLVARLKRFDPPPSVIVDSGGGIHAYWRLKTPQDLRNPARRLFVREVVYGLAHTLNADLTVHDPARVMGLPGTYNVGNGKTKVYSPAREVTVLHRDTTQYAVEDVSKHRRPVPTKGEAAALTSSLPPATGAPASLPAAQLRIPDRLRKLVVSGWVTGCGYPSRSELDQAVMIAMMRGGHRVDEIAAVFRDTANKISEKYHEKGADGERYLSVTLAASQDWVNKTSNVVPELRERNGQLESRSGKSWRVIFNRTLKAIARLTGEESGFRVEISTPSGPEQRTLRSYDMASNLMFKRALGMAGAWTGIDRDVQLLIPYLEAQNPPTRRAVKTIGLIGDEIIFPNAHLSPAGNLVTETDYLYLGKLADAKLEENDDWLTMAKTVVNTIPILHTRHAILPILGWFAATFAAPQIRKLVPTNEFPLLMVFGTPEAGKTTILEVMRTLTGISGALHSAPDNTRFANIELLSGTNTVPVVFDEHRRTDIRQHKTNLYPLLREAYQSGIVTRGRPDLTVVRYRLQAPVALGGETPFRDTALVDRTVHVRLDRGGKNKAALDTLTALPLHEFNAGFYRHVRAKDLPQLWKEADRLLPKAIRDNSMQFRQRHAWTVIAFGLLLLEPLWPREEILKAISELQDFRAVTKDDVSVSTKSVILEAVRIIAELVRARRIRDGVDYTIKTDGSDHYLWLIPAIVLPAVEEYCQRFPTDLPMTKEAILGRMREDTVTPGPVISKYQEVFKVGMKTARGICVHLEQVEKEMDIPVDYWLQTSIVMAETAP